MNSKINQFVNTVVSCYSVDKRTAIKEFGIKTIISCHELYINCRTNFYEIHPNTVVI